MKKLLFFTLAIFILSGCTIKNEKKSEINELQKNKECYEYKKDLENEFVTNESETIHESLDSLFYYSKTNSCVYVSTLIFYEMKKDKFQLNKISIRLSDFFTREVLEEARGDENIYQFKERILK